ncbi:Ig kappa chain V19-17-like, partial [Clarias magur]
FFTSAPSQSCYFFTESERIVTSVHDKNTSLTITAVNVSDTGLYYCSYMEKDRITFTDSVYLRVKDQFQVISSSDSPAVSFMLTVGFGAVIVIVILLSVLIFITLKQK